MRLCGPLRRIAAGAALVAAVACAGCSYQLGTMFSKSDNDATVTGSIGRHGAAHSNRTAQVSESDLAYARAAAADALAHHGKVNSVPWQNPQTGVGGNITPLAASYDQDGLPCRDFLASAMGAGMGADSQAWLQGSACRTASGEWQVKSLKPLKSG
ncbi:MAG: RT0821/Lpp0805 family surface protein [Xanthobacteraceae bacterium]